MEIKSATCRTLLESEAPWLSDYSIGFALTSTENGSPDASLGGSGTLVTVDEIQGILTASHVISLLERSRFVGLILPSRFNPEIHHPSLNIDNCRCIKFTAGGVSSEGPDLGLLIPPPDMLGILKAKKSFYNLSIRQERMLKKPPPFDHGFWMLSGFAAEWTRDLPPERRFQKVKLFKGLHGEGAVTKEYGIERFDYLTFEALYNDVYEGPDGYGGFSGGGLWQLLVKPTGDSLQVTDRLLCGVAFYESAKKSHAGQITREITCHGRTSLYQSLVDKVRAAYSDRGPQ